MTRTFDAAATEAALPFAPLVEALRDAFADPGCAPQRHHHALPEGAALLLMPAWQRDWLGVKIVAVHPANAARGMDSIHATYLLSNAATGEPAALLDGGTLTARRTAAASALAASYLARPASSRLLLLGAGRVASLLPLAHRAVRPITQVWVWNRNTVRRDALIATLQSQGFDAAPATDLAAACANADIVSAATLATTPLIEGRWLPAGTHLDLVGAYEPTRREADDAALAGAQVFADTPAALLECGELAGWTEARLAGTLIGLCSGAAAGRTDPAARTVFKSVGTALEDLAAAVLACRSPPPGSATG